MRKLILISVSVAIVCGAMAQSVRHELRRNIRLSASNHLAYPSPRIDGMTPAPKGKKPFYISHYGRHGSRFLIGENEYDGPLATLARADSLDKLTPLGREVMERVATLRAEASGRLGELTPLGAEQHRQIAKRMYERFPEVFEGKVTVDARSTVVIRCILSMENELLQLMSMNPALDIRHDASWHDMYYMNYDDRELVDERWSKEAKDALEAFAARHVSYDGVMGRLFSDTAYVRAEVDARRLGESLFKLASNVQNCESRATVTLYDIFTDDEIYANWQKENVRWYISYGACPLNGGRQPFTQRNLLQRIIEEADSCIALPRPGATLRFGHETMVLPLTCLLGLDGYDRQISDMEKVEKKGWVNYRIFPMGANIQFIFYRSGPEDKDVVFKVLLNENEATLPLKTDIAPYYHWNDFRKHYLDKLASFR